MACSCGCRCVVWRHGKRHQLNTTQPRLPIHIAVTTNQPTCRPVYLPAYPQALPMFLNVTANVTNWSPDQTECSLVREATRGPGGCCFGGGG